MTGNNTSSSDARELTFGERQAGITFNPSSLPEVDEIKLAYAALFDHHNDARNATDDPDKKRFYSMAISDLNTAQMLAVKAVTWKS